jgi:hypothetical protein
LLQSNNFDYHFNLPPASWGKSDECCVLGFYMALASAYLRRPCKEGVSGKAVADDARRARWDELRHVLLLKLTLYTYCLLRA